jgi:hypothetical protein
MTRQHANDHIYEEVYSQKDSKNANVRINDAFSNAADASKSVDSFWSSFHRGLKKLEQYIGKWKLAWTVVVSSFTKHL